MFFKGYEANHKVKSKVLKESETVDLVHEKQFGKILTEESFLAHEDVKNNKNFELEPPVVLSEDELKELQMQNENKENMSNVKQPGM